MDYKMDAKFSARNLYTSLPDSWVKHWSNYQPMFRSSLDPLDTPQKYFRNLVTDYSYVAWNKKHTLGKS